MLLSGTDMRYYRSACVLELLIMRYIVESESDGCGVSDFHVAAVVYGMFSTVNQCSATSSMLLDVSFHAYLAALLFY